MPLALALVLGFAPMIGFASFIRWLDRYEPEPRWMLASSFLWGAVIACGGAFVINTLLGIGLLAATGSEEAALIGTTTLVAPVVEELLKGLAVLLVFACFRREFDSVVDGITYAGITATGFAAVENTLYIYRDGYGTAGLEGLLSVAFIRIVLVGWMHPFFTAFVGIGLAIARTTRTPALRWLAPLSGFALAIGTHAFHNGFAMLVGGLEGFALGLAIDWVGYACMTGFIGWMIWRERDILRRQLAGELAAGRITAAQYAQAISFTQVSAHLGALARGRYRAVRAFYQSLGELAHHKEHLERHGEEHGHSTEIARHRAALPMLAERAYS
jgi:RsiW-degrading membrane proteinase PrsW (M82 family)